MLGWQIAATMASIVSALAIVAGTVFVVVQLRQAAKDRYLSITSHLFEIWQAPDFQDDQLFILHKFPATTWEEFKAHRGERPERALHRVGGFYDRVGSLILNRLIEQDDILPTVGGYAIAVWDRIEALVAEARIHENAFLFESFQRMLPNCRECYVPLARPFDGKDGGQLNFVEPRELKGLLDRNAAVLLDVRKATDQHAIKGSTRPNPNDLTGWLAAVAPDQTVVVYCS